jgi:hypothetical protein
MEQYIFSGYKPTITNPTMGHISAMVGERSRTTLNNHAPLLISGNTAENPTRGLNPLSICCEKAAQSRVHITLSNGRTVKATNN